MSLVRFADAYSRFLQKFMVAVLVAMLFAMLLMMLGRYVPFIPPFLWTLEIVQFGMIWIAFTGAAVAIRERSHFLVDVIPPRLQRVLGPFLQVFYLISVGAFCYVYIAYGFEYFVEWSLGQHSEIMGISLGFVFASVPVFGVSSLLFLIADVVEWRARQAEGGR